MSGDNTRRKHGSHPNWEPGFCPNPQGRPRGSRNALGEAFIEALHGDFVEHGAAAIERVREEFPAQYLKTIAMTLPKELHVETAKGLEEWSDAELLAVLEKERAQLTPEEIEAAKQKIESDPKCMDPKRIDPFGPDPIGVRIGKVRH
jgi:hypothetical protein